MKYSNDFEGSVKMLSDNIKNYRKKNNMSQDELAEKLGVSRQSISLWETGQTQPTIDNIIALAKIFNVSSDMLLGNCDSTSNNTNISKHVTEDEDKTSKKKELIIICIVALVVIAVVATTVAIIKSKHSKNGNTDSEIAPISAAESENMAENNSSTITDPEKTVKTTPKTSSSVKNNDSKTPSPSTNTPPAAVSQPVDNVSDVPVDADFDLFSYCKNFAIEKGTLNGDYCIYQQVSSKYGGRSNEYFDISYWSGSDMVEFCLHCPLDDTYGHNFFIRMRGGYNGKYEYLSSKYYRDTGESLRSATGYIDPAVFSKNYPISCDKYEGSSDGQDLFMEESRIGICDLIDCLKKFVTVENMECDFSDFGFVNF